MLATAEESAETKSGGNAHACAAFIALHKFCEWLSPEPSAFLVLQPEGVSEPSAASIESVTCASYSCAVVTT